jgi:alpha-1,3-mannosyltransferase
VATLAQSLSELGWSNEVLTLDRLFYDAPYRLPPREVIDGVRVRRVPMVGHSRFFLPLIDDRLLARFDVIHVHGIDGMFDRIARHRRAHNQVLAATTHGLFFHTPWMMPVKHLYLHTATRLSARRYDVLIANSLSDMTRLRPLSDDIVHLPNGITPLGAFMADGRDVLYLGRLAHHKHVERLIAAMAEPDMADRRLHVVGPERDVTHLHLARVADSLGVGDRIILHGKLSRKRLAEVAKRCGLFASASTYEGFGMSLIEAMSVGLIPVVEANPAFTELIDGAQCGAVTDFTRPALAARIMRHCLDNADWAQRNRTIAFSDEFSWRGHQAAYA